MSKSAPADWQTVKARKEQDRDALCRAFEACGGSVNGSNTVRCIIHDDGGKANGTIAQAEGGKWYFKCFKCEGVHMDVWDLEARALGIDTKAHLANEKAKSGGGSNGNSGGAPAVAFKQPEKKRKSFPSAQAASDFYVKFRSEGDEPCELVMEKGYPYFCRLADYPKADYVVFRYRNKTENRKEFYQCHRRRDSDDLWYSGLPPKEMLAETGGKLPLFNRKRLEDATHVLVVEGEKSVESFHILAKDNDVLANFACITSPMGAGQNGTHVANAFWQELSGKEVWTWADNDALDVKTGLYQGAEYMRRVSEELQNLPEPPRIYRVRHQDLTVDGERIDLPVKGDLADFLALFETREAKTSALLEVLSESDYLDRTSGYGGKLKKIISGDMKHIHFARCPQLSKLSQALLPGTITLLCGDPGARKSFMVLEQYWRQREAGHSASILLLEEDLEYWQGRAHAQMAGMSGMMSFDWIKENPGKALASYDEIRDLLDRYSDSMICPDNIPTLDWVGDWILGEIAKGTEIIIVDPVTAALAATKEVWIEDQKFLFKVKMALKGQAKSRVILTTHPRTEQLKTGKPGLAGLAGGQAYPRFSQSIFWLRKFQPAETGDLMVGGGQTLREQSYFNSLEILKARSGPGAGRGIALDLDPQSLCFTEIGVILEGDD